MENSTTLRLRAPKRTFSPLASDSGSSSASSSVQPKLPRLNPISVAIKAFISEATLPAFQCAERSAATFFKFNTILDWIEDITDPIAFYLVVHEYAPHVTLTVDYAEGDDLTTLAERAKARQRVAMDQESAAVAGFLRSDFSGLLTALLDALDAFQDDLTRDPAAVLGRYRIEGSNYLDQDACVAHFLADYLGADQQRLDVFNLCRDGLQTLGLDGLLEPFRRTFGFVRGPTFGGDDLDTQRLLLCLGRSLKHLANALIKLPGWVPQAPDAKVTARVAQLNTLVEATEGQIEQAEKQRTETLFQGRAARLIELTGDEHLRFSLEQGFPSRATYFQLLEKTLIERLRERVVRPVVAAGLLPSEDHAQIRLRTYHEGGSLLEDDYVESRSPSLAVLKLYAGLRDFLRTDEVAHAFGVRSDPDKLTFICYRPDADTDIYGDDHEPERQEAIVVMDMFAAPLAPLADHLNIFIGKPPASASPVEGQEGRP